MSNICRIRIESHYEYLNVNISQLQIMNFYLSNWLCSHHIHLPAETFHINFFYENKGSFVVITIVEIPWAIPSSVQSPSQISLSLWEFLNTVK